ncbi:hypothetical protein BURPSS13_0168 [Burkholderia pseudomallei S13]|nr:hypothetical protein BURPSS13_0168 [Burkholderia pseudomallei S13]
MRHARFVRRSRQAPPRDEVRVRSTAVPRGRGVARGLPGRAARAASFAAAFARAV